MNSTLETANYENKFAVSSSSNCVVAISTISWQEKSLYVGEVNKYMSELSSNEEIKKKRTKNNKHNNETEYTEANVSDESLELEQLNNQISYSRKGYMDITATWINESFELNEAVLAVSLFQYPHTANAIANYIKEMNRLITFFTTSKQSERLEAVQVSIQIQQQLK
ncbi:16847_t:CDS:2, partial [Racocetra persica]